LYDIFNKEEGIMKTNRLLATVLVSTLCLSASPLFAQSGSRGIDAQLGYSFSYQGTLNDNGAPADGTYDMRFSLFSSSGVQINSPVTYIGIAVVDGLFTVDLEFDPAIWTEFASIEKYLQIEVRTNGGGGYTALTPRTLLTSAPHANVAQVAHRLTFPYTESLTGYSATDTAMDLSVNEGTALRLFSSNVGAPALLVEGDNPFAEGFFDQTALFNDLDTRLGLVSVADRFSLVGYNNSPDGQGAILAEVAVGGSPDSAAVYATNNAAGKSAFLAQGDYAGIFNGDLHVNNGIATQDYSFSPSPMAPVGYGFVNSNGTVASATANIGVVWNAGLNQYEVSLSDQAISFSSHTILVTVVDTSEPHVATTNVISGNIVVKIWDINSGNVAIQDNFQIVVFNPNPESALTLSPVPAGMDPELYYQQTGTTPPYIPNATPVEMPEPASAVSAD
tara:strand:- start:115 stop:1458 length:1344 start_codon:yes stop_codon:yes gene_type:complete